jgi:AcrR family transcriptional regulator
VPKRVDPEQRRRVIAEAIYEVIGDRGWEAVTLRDVARAAGVSMGQVQHYFTTKTDMLLFALGHMRARALTRLEQQLAAVRRPTQRDQVRAAMSVMLPVDKAGRQEASVNIAFFSAATVTPAYAQVLRDGYSRLLEVSKAQLRTAAESGELSEGIDPEPEAAGLFYLVQGLIGPVLIGQLTPHQAVDILDHQLNRIFR